METLEVRNFLSIKHVKLGFSYFNIITGDMGAGKSLCMKLLKFFEDIIPNLLLRSHSDFRANLDCEIFFGSLVEEFKSTFVLPTDDGYKSPSFTIGYVFLCGKETFDAVIEYKNKNGITFESLFLRSLLADWESYLHKKSNSGYITPDGFEEDKRFFHADILKRFNSHFPIATNLVPASRAALAVSSDYIDPYLKEFDSLIRFLPQIDNNKNQETQRMIDIILKAKIKIKTRNNLYLEFSDGREIPIAKASSGQQEIVYILMLLSKLGNFSYTYGKSQSVFIEEPETQLFPLEQKCTIELIAQVYNFLKESKIPARIFITTHSPYVLNSINNMLKKGELLKKYESHIEKINKKISIPSLLADDISAYFINRKGEYENMLDKDNKYFYADKIDNIAIDINEMTTKLQELNNDLLD